MIPPRFPSDVRLSKSYLSMLPALPNVLVCSHNSDITLRSSDGVLFRFFKKKLEVHSAAFAGAEGFALLAEDVVDLAETSDVLDILLQFMSTQRPPSLRSLPFSVMNPLAEAVEKYEVVHAMDACETRMK